MANTPYPESYYAASANAVPRVRYCRVKSRLMSA